MNLLTRLLRAYRKHVFLPLELYESIQSYAEKEGVSPGELIGRVVGEAETRRQAAESLPTRWKSLTPREQQVVCLVCRKLSTRAIAEKLGIAPETVRNHLKSAMVKLDLHDRHLMQQMLERFDFSPWGE